MKSLLTLVIILSGAVAANAEEGLPAFPGAEGFGAYTQGGRGGRVIIVENLSDSGPGSLRAAVEARGARYIMFRVSGIIELKEPLEVRRPYCTIAGQTAPGDGFCLKNFDFIIRAHDVVVRHVRFRPGDEPAKALKERGQPFQPDAISIMAPAHDVIIDHCSGSWSTDETCTVSGAGITNVTVQWCIIAESLNDGNHLKGPHGYGSLIRTNGNVTYHHNLYAHHRTRCPRPGTYGDGSVLFDFRNNVIYDGNGYSAQDPVRMNYVGNYIRMPNGPAFAVGGDATELFQEGNFQEDAGAKNDDFWQLITQARPQNKRAAVFDVATVETQSAQEAYESVLESAGATLPKRDAVDTRLIDQVRNGTGKIIDSQADVGGWPVYRSSTAPKDTDNDGMPDAWETEHELNPEKDDHLGDADGDGYPNIEEFLDGTKP